MKVYVDELPECCNECPCCNYDTDYGSCCNLGAYEYDDYYQTLYKHPRCPLQSLTDYTKQVRKEVVQEISKNVAVDKINGKLYARYDDLAKVLDQIQGETK